MAPKNGMGADIVPEQPELGNNIDPQQPEIEIKEEHPVENGKQADINDKEKKIEYLDNLLNEEQPIIDEFSDLFYDSNKAEIEKMNVDIDKKVVDKNIPEKEEKAPEDVNENPTKEEKAPEDVNENPIKEEKAPEDINENPIKEEKAVEESKDNSEKQIAPEEEKKVSEEKVSEEKAPQENKEQPEEQKNKEQGASEDDKKDSNKNDGNKSDGNGNKDKDEPQVDFSKRPSLFENVMLFLGLASPELKRRNAEYKEQLRKAYEANQKKKNSNEKGAPTSAAEAKETEKTDKAAEKVNKSIEKDAAKGKTVSDKDLRELISLKINDEEKMLKKYPQDSLYAMAIRENVKRLSDLHTMLLEGTASAEQIHKCSEKAVGGLVAQDLLKQSMDKSPDIKKAFTKDGEGKHLFGENFLQIADHPAVKASIESNGKTAVTELLTKPDSISRYSSASAKNISEFKTKGSKLVDANNFGAITKNPQTGKWEKMSGVSNGAVTASINTMRTLTDENKIFNTASHMARQNISPEKQSKAIEDRIAEIDKLLSTKSDDKAICSVASIAKKNLTELKESGMPKKGSENYEEQKEAYRSVVASLFALEHIMHGNETAKKAIADDEAKAAEYIKMHRNKDILNGMSRSFGDTFAKSVINHSIENRDLYKAIRSESKLRRKCGIPESAECYGALFRNSPHEKWQEIKTASEDYINESYLGLMKDKPLTDEIISANKKIFINAPAVEKEAPQKNPIVKEGKPSAELNNIQPAIQPQAAI